MKRKFLRLTLASLFVLSVGTAGTVVAKVAQAGPALPACSKCSVYLGCPGSTCNCEYNPDTGLYGCRKSGP